MRNNAAYLPESPIVYIILPKSIRNRASFRIFAGRGAILWTGMSEVVRRRIFRVYSDVSDFILKGNGNRKKIC